uniref:Putative secreted protein n=1 Tax=Ixodes ricinus TaxID=34613 RepID=A0A6B0URW3_IXORI
MSLSLRPLRSLQASRLVVFSIWAPMARSIEPNPPLPPGRVETQRSQSPGRSLSPGSRRRPWRSSCNQCAGTPSRSAIVAWTSTVCGKLSSKCTHSVLLDSSDCTKSCMLSIDQCLFFNTELRLRHCPVD